MALANRDLINPNHFRPGRASPRTLGAYVLVIQLFDRLLVKMQFVGNVLDRGASAAPANIVGKALGVPRVGCQEGKPAVHIAAVAAAFPSYLSTYTRVSRPVIPTPLHSATTATVWFF